jgi:antitoxin CcdA
MASTAPHPQRPPLPQKLLDEALRLGVDVEGLSEEEARRAVTAAWQEENREAIEGWNRWVEKNGLPLAQFRQF